MKGGSAASPVHSTGSPCTQSGTGSPCTQSGTGRSPITSLQCPLLHASVTLEYLRADGTVLRQVRCARAELSLLRHNRHRLALRVHAVGVTVTLSLQRMQLHRRFLREGRASLSLSGPPPLRVLVANAPPAQLLVFMRVLSVKVALASRQKAGPAGPGQLEEISPLTSAQVLEVSASVEPGLTPKAGAGRALKLRNMNVKSGTALTKKLAGVADDPIKPKTGNTQIVKNILSNFLNREQRVILEVAVRKTNLFFTGSAGTGKSFLLRKIIASLPPDSTFVTASTGAAACHLHGGTLHAFAGIGSGVAPLERCVEMARRPGLVDNWRRCQHLVIDEVSMIDADYFEKIEAVARQVRNSTLPFGGIHLILCGDFLQLPPVTKAGGTRARFCFESSAWQRCVEEVRQLRHVHRQSDRQFVSILNNIRLGRCTQSDSDVLRQTISNCVGTVSGIVATRLCTHLSDVTQINAVQLANLAGEKRVYSAEDSGNSSMLTSLSGADKLLTLKVGAQVMLTKNLDVKSGLVNGSRGCVVSFIASKPFAGVSELPEVKFACGVTMVVSPEWWVVRSPGASAEHTRRQLPLRLAWAFSVHKSQGMTLDSVEVSLSRSFEPGQAYVALSRAKSLQCLRVLDFQASCVRAHPTALKFYRSTGLTL